MYEWVARIKGLETCYCAADKVGSYLATNNLSSLKIAQISNKTQLYMLTIHSKSECCGDDGYLGQKKLAEICLNLPKFAYISLNLPKFAKICLNLPIFA